jgi:phage terminase large subunit-like protein
MATAAATGKIPRPRKTRSAVAGWPPRWLTPVPAADLRRSRGELIAEFGEACCRITKDTVAGPSGQLLKMRGWQRELLRHVYAVRRDGRLRHRQALVGMPRKNGKSGVGSVLALDGLIFGPEGGEVYSCAGDKEQAKIVFGDAKRMVELDPDLSALVKPYRDVIEFPATGSIYRALSAEAFTKEGLNPTVVLFDEVHVQPTRELWDVMSLAMGARVEPLMLGITTAGVRTDITGNDSLCYGLYQYGKRVATGEITDPAFFMAWWEAPEGADHTLESTWQAANPGYDDLVSAEDFHALVGRTPENEFRTKRCNQWVSTTSTWFPAGLWDSRHADKPIDDGATVVLGFDGSRSRDYTGLVAATVEDVPHFEVVGLWERPADAPADWQVPRQEILAAIRAARDRYDVAHLVADPYIWMGDLEDLELEGFDVIRYEQTAASMVPATQRFDEAVRTGRLSHDGDPRLARHVDNVVLKFSSKGAQLAKEHKHSPRKIDLAVAAVMAFDIARPNDDGDSGWMVGL